MEDKDFFRIVNKSKEIWVLFRDKSVHAFSSDDDGLVLSVWQSKRNVELFITHQELNNAYRPVYFPVDIFKRTFLENNEMNIVEFSVNNIGLDEKCLCYTKEEFMEQLE